MVKERIIQFAVSVATGLMKHDPDFAHRVFVHMLEVTCAVEQDAPAYDEAVKELQGFCVHHLQSLAIQFPDYLIVGSPTCGRLGLLTSLRRNMMR